MQSPFLFFFEGSGIFKTYTLILPGIKKDRMAAVGILYKINKNKSWILCKIELTKQAYMCYNEVWDRNTQQLLAYIALRSGATFEPNQPIMNASKNY